MDMREPVMLIHPLVWRDEELRDVRAVFLKDFVAPARIGAHCAEEGRTQRLRLNLCVYLRPPFDWNDRLEDVLDYDRLRQGILDILAQGHIRLIETLGERHRRCCSIPAGRRRPSADRQAGGARRLRGRLRDAAALVAAQSRATRTSPLPPAPRSPTHRDNRSARRASGLNAGP
jgi:hypothetical protein